MDEKMEPVAWRMQSGHGTHIREGSANPLPAYPDVWKPIYAAPVAPDPAQPQWPVYEMVEWDSEGVTRPKAPYSWETVARIAIDALLQHVEPAPVAQEPVAWLTEPKAGLAHPSMQRDVSLHRPVNRSDWVARPLYAAPPSLEAQELTAIATLIEFIKTAPGRLPRRVQDAIALLEARNAR